jgi:hypothetical protein
MQDLFPALELIRPKLIQKLFNIVPKLNAIIEINNLLGTKLLNDITIEEIGAISAKYRVNLHKKFPDHLKEMYQRYLNLCLGYNMLTIKELNNLKLLKYLLLLTDKEVSILHYNLATDIYNKANEQTINYFKLEMSKEKFINKLQGNLRLPDEIERKLSNERFRRFLAIHLIGEGECRQVTPEELNELNQILRNLNVETKLVRASFQQFERYRLYWLIEYGILPDKYFDISLPRNEQCYFKINADWLGHRTPIIGQGYGGPDLRIKMMKQVFYRSGSVEMQRKIKKRLTFIDSGSVYVTQKRVIFEGYKANTSIPMGKIRSVAPFSDGLVIETNNGKNLILRVSKNADILAMFLGRAIKDLYTT